MLKRDRSLLVLAGAALTALALVTLAPPRDLVLYNPSPSVPEGFYVRIDAPVSMGAFVTVRARDAAPQEARRRGFEDRSDRFIKRVAAGEGARVCGAGDRLIVDGQAIAIIASADAVSDFADDTRQAAVAVSGPAPANVDGRLRQSGWHGCRLLAAGEVLLLGDTDDSFDGRYWGPLSVDLIEGVWRKL